MKRWAKKWILIKILSRKKVCQLQCFNVNAIEKKIPPKIAQLNWTKILVLSSSLFFSSMVVREWEVVQTLSTQWPVLGWEPLSLLGSLMGKLRLFILATKVRLDWTIWKKLPWLYRFEQRIRLEIGCGQLFGCCQLVRYLSFEFKLKANFVGFNYKVSNTRVHCIL